MGSLLEAQYPPARTPSRTSHAFRTHQNDFSPFGSLAELNAATATRNQMHTPHGSDTHHGRDPAARHNRSPLPPTEEAVDLGESFYGEEVDYGNVTHQMNYEDPRYSGQGSPYYHGSQHLASHAGTGWGSRSPSLEQTPREVGRVYSIHDDQFTPPMPEKWPGGSRAGTANSQQNHMPTIQVHEDDQDYMYPPVQHVRTKSSRATVHHISDDNHSQVVRAKSSRAAIVHPHSHSSSDRDDDESHPQPMRVKSSRATTHRQRNISTGSRGTAGPGSSFVIPGSIPAHFELDGDDVILRVYLPWTDRLNERPCRFHITGVDGRPYSLEIDYQWTKMVQGSAKFRGAGLPRERRGRGSLIIDWEIWFEEGEISD